MGKLLTTYWYFWCLLVLEFAIHSTICVTNVTLHEYPVSWNAGPLQREKTFLIKPTDQTVYSKGDLGTIMGFTMNIASCIRLWKEDGNWGTWLDDRDKLDSNWIFQVTAVSLCPSSTVTWRCPEGTYIKKVEWSFGFGWDMGSTDNNGLKLSCYEPSEIKTPAQVFDTNPQLTSSVSGERIFCTGVRGLIITFDKAKEIGRSIKPICDRSTNPNPYTCSTGIEAVSGITITYEHRTKWIKEYGIHCSEVKAIEEICKASDLLNNIATCDGTDAITPFYCELFKTVGFGGKSSSSNSQTSESTFHAEFSNNFEVTDFEVLKNKFKVTVGVSSQTTYNWESTAESTWSMETQFKIVTVVPSGCITIIREVLGTCSFLRVRPPQIFRKDICPEKEFDTTYSLPINQRSSKIVVVPMPKAMVNPKNKLQMELLRNGFVVLAEELRDYYVPFDGELGYGLISSSEAIESGHTNLVDVSKDEFVLHDSYGNNLPFRSNSHWSTEVVGPHFKKFRPVLTSLPRGSRY